MKKGTKKSAARGKRAAKKTNRKATVAARRGKQKRRANPAAETRVLIANPVRGDNAMSTKKRRTRKRKHNPSKKRRRRHNPQRSHAAAPRRRRRRHHNPTHAAPRRRRRRRNPGLPAPVKALLAGLAGTAAGVAVNVLGVLASKDKPGTAIKIAGAIGALGGGALAMKFPILGTAIATGCLDAAAQTPITGKVTGMLGDAVKARAIKSKIGDLDDGIGDPDDMGDVQPMGDGDEMQGLTAENMVGLLAENMKGLVAENMHGTQAFIGGQEAYQG